MVTKDDSRMKVIDPTPYSGSGNRALVNFCWQYMNVFAIRNSQYADEEVKAQLARLDLKGELTEAWYEREESEGGGSLTTWQEFKEFFEERLDPTNLRITNVHQRHLKARQGFNQTVSSFASYLKELDGQMKLDTELQHCNILLGGLRSKLRVKVLE